MRFTFELMSEKHARTALQWRYRAPYARYNHDPRELERNLQEWLDPKNSYYSILGDWQDLVGYCCFGVEAQVPGGDYDNADTLDIGMGMRPNLMGMRPNLRVAGIAPFLLRSILDWAKSEFSPVRFRVTVATFNQRVIRLCAEAGFSRERTFVSRTGPNERDFVQMTRRV